MAALPRVLTFDETPAAGLPDADRLVVLAVARVMLSLHAPDHLASEWSLYPPDAETTTYTVVVVFPAAVPMFTARQFKAVEQANVVRVGQVWVEQAPPPAGGWVLSAEVRLSEAAADVTDEDILILRGRLGLDAAVAGARKRQRQP
jgi:hypothetical protein